MTTFLTLFDPPITEDFSGLKHVALDLVGLIPGVGEPADFLNGLTYLKEGNYLFAVLSFISMVPAIGDLIGKGGKVLAAIGVKSPVLAKVAHAVLNNKGAVSAFMGKLNQNKQVSPYIPRMQQALDQFTRQAVA